MHEALGVHYGEVDHASLANVFLQSYEREGNKENLDEYEPNKEMGPKLLKAYVERDYMPDQFGVVQVESTFCVQLGDSPYKLAGRADLVTARNGRIEVVDHKTAKSTSTYYVQQWAHDFGMIGYCYGVEKTLGHRVYKYAMNIIKKLKTVDKTDKVCPDCRNGKRKKLECKACGYTGRVPIEPVKPFERHYFRVTPDDYKKLEDNRICLAQEIEEETSCPYPEYNLYAMNCRSCHAFKGCPYVDLCWENEGDWWDVPDVLLHEFEEQDKDYVDDMNSLVKEELY
jgi:hypothetical protein